MKRRHDKNENAHSRTVFTLDVGREAPSSSHAVFVWTTILRTSLKKKETRQKSQRQDDVVFGMFNIHETNCQVIEIGAPASAAATHSVLSARLCVRSVATSG